VRLALRRGTLRTVGWTFVYLMLILKLPIIGLLYLVWWAVHQSDDEAEQRRDGGGGGTKVREPRHPRPRLPRHPRRGPHGDPAAVSPPRVRHTVARARPVQR
jgi:hypothetical protein